MKAVQKQTLVCLIADAFLRVAVTARVKSSNFIDTDLFVHRSLLSVRFGFLIRFHQYDLISGPLWGETPLLKTINITTCVWRFFLTIFFFLKYFLNITSLFCNCTNYFSFSQYLIYVFVLKMTVFGDIFTLISKLLHLFLQLFLKS